LRSTRLALAPTAAADARDVWHWRGGERGAIRCGVTAGSARRGGQCGQRWQQQRRRKYQSAQSGGGRRVTAMRVLRLPFSYNSGRGRHQQPWRPAPSSGVDRWGGAVGSVTEEWLAASAVCDLNQQVAQHTGRRRVRLAFGVALVGGMTPVVSGQAGARTCRLCLYGELRAVGGLC